ncbi:MAG: glycosyltransferase family 87 protein [Terracidiphilus sp.]|jgi:glycosyl transferase family 87
MRQVSGRKVAAACIVLGGALLVCAIYSIDLTNKSATERDYIQYWAAGHLLVDHANPYSLEAILRIEQTAGLEGQDPKASVSPPVALALLAPLGFVSAKTGLILWSLAQLGCLACSIWVLWIVLGKPDSRYHLLGFAFAPALASLQAGQLGIFMLCGIVLFIFLCDARPFLAGVVLLPCALKPHLFLPFMAALLLWTIYKRKYILIVGFLSAFVTVCGLTVLLDHRIWFEYFDLMRSTRLFLIPLPTLSSELRFLIAPEAVWLQYLPAAVASAWAMGYFWTRRERWDWMDQGLLVLLISLVCAPYAWLMDEAVLLPAVLVGLYRAIAARRSWIPIAVFGVVALIELFADLGITSWYYTWTTPAWLAWYLYATGTWKSSRKRLDESPAVLPS